MNMPMNVSFILQILIAIISVRLAIHGVNDNLVEYREHLFASGAILKHYIYGKKCERVLLS